MVNALMVKKFWMSDFMTSSAGNRLKIDATFAGNKLSYNHFLWQ